MLPFALETFMKRLADLERRFGHLLPLGPPSSSDPRQGLPRAAVLTALLLITILAGAIRLHAVASYSYPHPDEEIARAVVTSVLKSGDDDTNWARTDVSKQFRYTEYNFSSYYLFAADVERLRGNTAVDLKYPAGGLRKHLRELSAVLGALCVLLVGFLGWRIGGRLCGLTAAVLSACSVTLLQDGIYARPETFVTLLTLLLLLILSSERIHRGLVMLVAGLIVGVLIACKITFLMYLPFPLMLAPALLSTPRDGASSERHLFLWAGSISSYFIGIGAGFALGAPYALHYPWEYVQGIVPLIMQYKHATWTMAANAESPALERLAYGLSYLVQTLGYPALLLALAGLGRLVWRREARGLLVLGGPLLTLVYFLQTETFYERNFSQAMPILFVLTGLGIQLLVELIKRPGFLRHAAASVLLAVSATTPAMVTARAIDPALDGRYQARIEAEERTLSQGDTVSLFFSPNFNDLPAADRQLCGSYLYASRIFQEQKQLDRLVADGYRVAGYVHSVFGDEPISTLQTYLSPSMIYLAPPAATGDCRLELAPLSPRPGESPVHASVTRSDGWPTGAAADAGWPWPLYDSRQNSDANTGRLQIGPFRACGDVVIPYTVGIGRSDVSLKVMRHDSHGDTALFDGIPPAPIVNGQWQQMKVRQPAGDCASYTIQAEDDGTGWGAWIGIGMPVVFQPQKDRH